MEGVIAEAARMSAANARARARHRQAQPADVYLDANATTQPFPEVIDFVTEVMATHFGNPASAHWLGGESRTVLERARDGVGRLLSGCLPEGIVFTSGGTEANNAVFASVLRDRERATVITTCVEHASVLRPAEAVARDGGSVVFLPVSTRGVADPASVTRALAHASESPLVSIQWANSETGVVQPMQVLVAEARRVRPDAVIHSDIAQAIGRVPINLSVVPLDVVTFSAHKIHGPQGVGAMVLRDPSDRRIKPQIVGGGQERGLGSGTPNVPGAAGFGLAARMRAACFDSAVETMGKIRDAFETLLLELIPSARVNAGGAGRVPNTSNVRFPGIGAIELVARLDSKGIACSTGSACSAARPEPSHVLTAMGLSEAEAFSSVRFSFSVLNTMDEALWAARAVAETLGELA